MSALDKLTAKIADEVKAKSIKTEDKVEEVSVTKMPSGESVVVKDSNYNLTRRKGKLTADEKRVLDTGVMVKQLRLGKGLSDGDIYDLKEMAYTKAPTLTSDLEDLLIATDTLSGNLVRDIWEDTQAAQLFGGLKEVTDLSETITLEDTKMKFKVIGEGADGEDTNSDYTTHKWFVNKIMGVTRGSYETSQRSLVNIATEKMGDLRQAAREAMEAYILNGDNSVTHMDADIAALAANTPEKFVKGIRKIASEKPSDVDFGAIGTTDKDIEYAIKKMQLLGGKYLNRNQVKMGNVALLVTENFYARISLMEGYTSAEKAGKPSTLASGAEVDTFHGIPVVVMDYFPEAVNASGYVDAVGANNTKTHCVMINTSMFQAYYYGVPVSEMDRNIVNQTNIWTLSMQIGFNGRYDRKDSVGTVDTTRPYAIRGINIDLV